MTAFADINAMQVGANTRDHALIRYLRAMVVAPGHGERFHAIFLDRGSGYLGDGPLGFGSSGILSFRMRELFGRALALDAKGIVVAHNHPSGHCRPSKPDIESTRRLKNVASALDIDLLDHLILTQSEVYSMRAGGLL